MTNDDIGLHSRGQNDLVKFEFLTKVTVFNIHDEILNGSIDKKGQLMKYNQGDGLTLVSTQYNRLGYNVRLKDIFSSSIQLFEQSTASFKHTLFFATAGQSKYPYVYGPVYYLCLKIILGDSEQTLRVLVAYYRQKRNH